MAENETTCRQLVDKCKDQAKQLAEITATRRKVHWTSPNFISFCVSVEDILSYGVKHSFKSSHSKLITSSGKVLQELGKKLPEAAGIYEKCFGEAPMQREDYTFVHGSSTAERKVGWIRAALVEAKLQTIVENILKNPRQYYKKQSVMCHQVYGEIFRHLIDGPCSIRYSRMKTSESSYGNPSPAEIVERHNQVLSISVAKGNQEEGGVSIATEAAWDHVRSLYQSNSATCLFGKNNICVQPAGFSEALQGYLTLQQVSPLLQLKWIPNVLLKDSSNAQSALWKTVMSVDIASEIAHIHCHRTPGSSAELILIGYDGIAYPPMLFPHQPSFFLFLECLENSLLPQGCLEPPLWYIKDQTTKAKAASSDSHLKRRDTHCPIIDSSADEGEWFDAIVVWNQVFRIRYGVRPQQEVPVDPEGSVIRATHPPPRSLPLNLTPSQGEILESTSSSEYFSDSSGERSPLEVSVEKPGSLARGDWEKFQSKVSRQLLARYFYSWLSHCRHMSKVRLSVAHMVGTATIYPKEDPSPYNHALSEQDWQDFQHTPDSEKQKHWPELVKMIYFRGVDNKIRKVVWPYLLQLYPVGSSKEAESDILSRHTEDYNTVTAEWKKVEETKKEVATMLLSNRTNGIGDEDNDEDSRGSSPSLSTISATPPITPSRSPRREIPSCESHDHLNEEQIDGSKLSSSDDHSKPVLDKSNHVKNDHVTASQEDMNHKMSHDLEKSMIRLPDDPELIASSEKLDAKGHLFVRELYNIDKDVPRCDRDYPFFQEPSNLQKLRNIVCSYVWMNIKDGYSQGMCDLLAPLLVVLESEPLAYACYLKLMSSAIKLFPPNTGMNNRLANIQSLMQVMEPEYFQYLADRPMGDGLFYCYRWLLVTFKREFSYEDIFRLWETIWAARISVSDHFEEIFALAIMKQFKTAIMDAHLDPSDILNLFTDLADKRAIDNEATIQIAQGIIHELQSDLTKKDC